MLDYYPREGSAAMTSHVARSIDAITSEARRLGLSSPERRERQALSRAANNPSVQVHFFETLTPTVAYVLGFIWVRGRVQTRPRHILCLRCPTAEEDALLAVRNQLGSHHRVQRRQSHTICKVCSYWLVESLLGKYGSPPGRANPDPPLPPVPAAYVPDLARGLLAGAGSVTASRITWAGTARAMGELEALIRAATGISVPDKTSLGKSHSLSWQAPDEVRTLSTWLRLHLPPFAEDASKRNSLSSLPGAL
jgi:hypothetical protein